jgi:hypothetical protein
MTGKPESIPPSLLTGISEKPMQMIADMTKSQSAGSGKDATTPCVRRTRRLVAGHDQSELGNVVVRLRYEAGTSAECTVLAAAPLRANGMEITSTALAARK